MRKRGSYLFAFAVVLSLAVVAARAETLPLPFIDPASPMGKRAIELALPELQKNAPDMKNYNVVIMQRKDEVGVLFCRPEPAPNILGCSEEGGGFEVHLTPDFARVIESYFSR